MTDWQKVHAAVLELEQVGRVEPDVLGVIAALLGEDDRPGLQQALVAEARRVVGPILAHYSEFTNVSDENAALVGLLQGITFARAYDRVKQDD